MVNGWNNRSGKEKSALLFCDYVIIRHEISRLPSSFLCDMSWLCGWNCSEVSDQSTQLRRLILTDMCRPLWVLHEGSLLVLAPQGSIRYSIKQQLWDSLPGRCVVTQFIHCLFFCGDSTGFSSLIKNPVMPYPYLMVQPSRKSKSATCQHD